MLTRVNGGELTVKAGNGRGLVPGAPEVLLE
jgi:hypothetical protein